MCVNLHPITLSPSEYRLVCAVDKQEGPVDSFLGVVFSHRFKTSSDLFSGRPHECMSQSDAEKAEIHCQL